MITMQMTQHIRELAADHGFVLCRFTRPNIGDEHRQALLDWLQAGYHADMAWMAEDTRLQRRLHPQSMLEQLRSIIVLGMPYRPPPPTPDHGTRGVISAYALGDDYHDVMKKRMRVFCRQLEALSPDDCPDQRIFVDTAPVMEHALAQSSGLGWLGKHSLSIDRKYGSWFMLGEVFTTADLPEDPPVSEHCGSCSACIDHCPTAAITAPGQVDARRCISWLTIEYRGMIAEHLRPLMGLHIYGCDDCQSCCPWNRHAYCVNDDALQPRKENIYPLLDELLRLDESSFRQRFRKSPIKRSGRSVLLRNCCIAAANAGDVKLIPVLHDLLNDDPVIAHHAAWAIEQLHKI